MRLTMQQYADHRKARGLTGQSKVAVWKAVKAGRIVQGADGLIDAAEADMMWSGNTDPMGLRSAEMAISVRHAEPVEEPKPVTKPARTKRPAPKPLPDAQPVEPEAEEPAPTPAPAPDTQPAPRPVPEATGFAKLREQREELVIARERLDLEERAGRLIPVEPVRSQWFQAGKMIMDRLLVLPNRIAAELAACTDPLLIASRLDEELRTALEAFTSDPPGLPHRRADALPVSGDASAAAPDGHGMG